MRVLRRAVVGVVSAAVVVSGLALAAPARAADAIVVWADPVHAPVISQLTAGGVSGTPVTVVTKDPATVRNELATVRPKDAPDVLWGDLAWTGELASTESIVPVAIPKKLRGQFRGNVLAGSNVGGQRYGVPVQISNLALVTNTTLVPQQPATFAALSDLALKLEKDKKARVPFALAQGEGTSPWSTFPLFSGVGGYLFGRNRDGSLNPGDVGLASRRLRDNAALIDGWNSSGLIRSTMTTDRARKAFANGNSAFFLAGPEDLQYLLGLKFAYRIGTLPPMVNGVKPVPLLTVHGFMVTRWAERHGVAEQASRLVGRIMARPKAQQALAGAQGWYPANTTAAASVDTGGGRIRAIGNAGVDGVPMPNIPQAAALWGPYATAWTTATAGKEATPAKRAFRTAQRAAVAGVNGGALPPPATTTPGTPAPGPTTPPPTD
jgi:arabinogalactan oligomer/maltooligosaccharide transport system substrate-binding protein